MTQSQQEKDEDRAKTLGAVKRSVITTVLLLALTGIMILYGNFAFDWKMLILLVIIGCTSIEIQAIRLVRQSFARAKVARLEDEERDAWARAEIEQMWSQRETRDTIPGVVRRLGTVGEARALVTELREKEHISAYAKLVMENHFLRWGDDTVIGDPNHVHVVIPPCHTIGYAIEESPSGVTLETVETHDDRYYILRNRGAIVHFERSGIIRMESYGPYYVS